MAVIRPTGSRNLKKGGGGGGGGGGCTEELPPRMTPSL